MRGRTRVHVPVAQGTVARCEKSRRAIMQTQSDAHSRANLAHGMMHHVCSLHSARNVRVMVVGFGPTVRRQCRLPVHQSGKLVHVSTRHSTHRILRPLNLRIKARVSSEKSLGGCVLRR